MPSIRLPVAATLVAAASLCADPLALRAQALPGWSFTTNIVTDSGGPTRTTSMAMRQRVTDRFLRTEFINVSGLNSPYGSPEGTYTVYDSRDTTVTMVMTNNALATVMSIPNLSGMGAQGMHSQTNAQPQVEDLGPGETLLGHATHHYRQTMRGTVDYTFANRSCTQRIDAVSDMWLASDVDIRPAVDAVMKHFRDAGAPTTSFEIPASPVADRGTPLRVITQSTYADPQGAPHTVKTTIEYVEISHTPIDPSVFAVPSDYKVMDMRASMAKLMASERMPATPDSVGSQTSKMLAKVLCR